LVHRPHRLPGTAGSTRGGAPVPGAGGASGRCADPVRGDRPRARPVRAAPLMRVCVVGSGGREHALGETLARSADVVVTPGNPGIEWSVRDAPDDIEADLFVIGPEAPLVD